MKIGNAVKKVTDSLGIEQCGGCIERQVKLNALGESLSSFFRSVVGSKDERAETGIVADGRDDAPGGDQRSE